MTLSEAKASSSTPNYYMFKASEEVVSLAIVTHAQSVLQAICSTT